ncbi:sulfotransferase 1B1-like [Clytia hemisphaerica]|uniref:Sulfotransferase domain-containing protein n=1 Tax=Clytia hemisphaerica TaxID=252671 RepID=A0A7M5UNB6_9CNID|eukprot:TCONS_00062565-protein
MAEQEITATEIKDETLEEYYEQSIVPPFHRCYHIKPFNVVFSKNYPRHHQFIQDFEVFKDDVFVSTFPKSGTRWLQELIWCMRHKNGIEKAKSKDLDERVPHFELPFVMDSKSIEEDKSYLLNGINNLSRPRTLKTHLPFPMLPKGVQEKGAKIVYCYRNPRDTMLSLFNFMKLIQNYTGTMELYSDVFLKGLTPYYLPYFSQVLGYWNRRSQENLLVLCYEEMQKDLPSVVRKIASFLDIEMTDEEVLKLCHHTSFDQMKKNPHVNVLKGLKMYDGQYLNKGKVGQWKDHFSEELIQKFELFEREGLKGTDLEFVFEL